MVSIDRVKPAYLLTKSLTDAGETTNGNQTHSTTTQIHSQDNERAIDREQSKSASIPEQIGVVTRAGRNMRFPERLQADR